MMLKGFGMPKEVRSLSQASPEVKAFVPSRYRSNEDTDESLQDRLRGQMIEQMEDNPLISAPEEQRQEPDGHPRLTVTAESAKSLTWKEMMLLSEFVAKRLSDRDQQIDPNRVAAAINAWQEQLLDPQVVES